MVTTRLPSAGFSITIRVSVTADASAIGKLTTAVGESGAIVTALDVVDSDPVGVTVDLTCDTADSSHADQVVKALEALPGVNVRKVSDRTFLLHLGGKIEVQSKVALRNRDELSRAYTPGVARVCMAIAENPADARRLTIKRNTVAVVSDGSAVLGLGNIGPYAAMPVMEGKAALFKRFGGVDAWPVVLDTQDTDEIVNIVRAIAPAYGGINLEDIAAPRCFEIEERLRDLLDIPVFHDDQHGTAICVLAALTNALRVVGKRIGDVRVVVSGAGAAGTAIMKLLLRQGVGDIIAYDRPGALHRGLPDLSPSWQWLVENTNSSGYSGDLKGAVRGADVFIGVSAPNLLTGDDIAAMAPRSIVLAGRPRAGPTSRTRSTTCWRSPACSAACWTPTPRSSPRRWPWRRPAPSRTWSARTRSTRRSSSRRCSTPGWPRRWRRRCARRPRARRPRRSSRRSPRASRRPRPARSEGSRGPGGTQWPVRAVSRARPASPSARRAGR